jgi:hypothetical protein
LIRERNRGEDFELFIVDLHRVDIRKGVGKRWVIKDLAALNYSSLGLPVQTRDRLRFLKRYLQKTRLEKSDLQLAQQILNKTGRIARHTERMKRRSDNL